MELNTLSYMCLQNKEQSSLLSDHVEIKPPQVKYETFLCGVLKRVF